MKVYGHPASTCTRKVLFTLAEKGADFEYVLVASSCACSCCFTALPGTALSPADLKARGEMEQWISVEASYFSPQAMKAVMNIWRASMTGEQPDPAVVAEGKAGAARALDVLEKALVGRDYLAGDFSLADISYAPYLQYLMDMGLGDIVTERPNVAAWWDRLSARPAWQKVLGK